VIGVELNDFVAFIFGNHPTLQRRRDSTILRAKHEISPDSCESSGWYGSWRTERRERLRALSCDRPSRDVIRAAPVQRGTRRRVRQDGDGRVSRDCEIGLDLILGSLWKLGQFEKTLTVLWHECRYIYQGRDPFRASCRTLGRDHTAHAVSR
jgi:hypothetical protein